MRLGAIFPQTEVGADPGAIRAYAQAVETMGFHHILIYDHVLGASTTNRPEWSGPYTTEHQFHEPFVLFGYLAALTERVELATGVIILAQRQTALVAKQAAEIDVLSNGRLRLGVGIGWNAVEYEALGEDFSNRGARSEEQIALLREFWTDPAVNFTGRWHQVTAAGLNPMPVQRPIPIWIGGYTDRTLRRVAKMGDGYFPAGPPDERLTAVLTQLRGYIRDEGRDPAEVGIEGRININQGAEAEWAAQAQSWAKNGATHLSINTMSAGLANVDAHISALDKARDAVAAHLGSEA
ncbi:MAG: LLM class F420-dependent oxidoreductase [Chloroflexota bacterium]|nr:LLM class F420-dependent oxidoreductase [Chloroflexota bacterium]